MKSRASEGAKGGEPAHPPARRLTVAFALAWTAGLASLASLLPAHVARAALLSASDSNAGAQKTAPADGGGEILWHQTHGGSAMGLPSERRTDATVPLAGGSDLWMVKLASDTGPIVDHLLVSTPPS